MELIQSGQKISVNIIKEDTLVEIIGTIIEVLDDRLKIELPPYFMRYIEFLDVGCALTAKIFSKLGTIDFNSIVIYSPLEDENFEIEFDVNALKFTQGSEYHSVDSIENLIIKRNGGVISTQTFEISTEYIKFYSDTALDMDESFECELKLPQDYGTIKFKVTVSAKDIIYDNEYTATIFSMNEQDRETLLYYMYVYANNNQFATEKDEAEEGNQTDNNVDEQPENQKNRNENEKND